MKRADFVGTEYIDFKSKTYDGTNVLIDEIKKDCVDGIILWVSGSGGSNNSESSYTCGLEFKGKLKTFSAGTGTHTANQSMILGAIACAKRIQKSYRVYLVSAAHLGFSKGFKGKGVNAKLIKELGEVIVSKGCQMTEILYLNGSEYIKAYLGEGHVSIKTDKNEPKEKYYAVAIGRVPGIYRTWEECSQNVTGYTDARYKKFYNEQEAMDFIERILAVTKDKEKQ